MLIQPKSCVYIYKKFDNELWFRNRLLYILPDSDKFKNNYSKVIYVLGPTVLVPLWSEEGKGIFREIAGQELSP